MVLKTRSITQKDRKLPAMADALRADVMAPRLCRALNAEIVIRDLQLIRHKSGRRCLIRYDIEQRGDRETFKRSIAGKVHHRRVDKRSLEIQTQLHALGYRVPRPLGAVPEVNMWLQGWVEGHTITDRLTSAGSAVCDAVNAAEVIAALHGSELQIDRYHMLDDELEILENRLKSVAVEMPDWSTRLSHVMDACRSLASSLPPVELRPIHRDFYPDQIIACQDGYWLIDLDLASKGDPALDIGNFLAHVSEFSLRELGDPPVLRGWEIAMVERYLALAPEVDPRSISIYKTLSLARHIQISRQFPDRIAWSGSLLELCEARLNLR